MDFKKIIRENVGIAFPARNWANIIYDLLENMDASEPRLIIEGEDYPEEYKEFSVDYIVVDFNSWTNGYLDKTSGYDKDNNYVVHIMVLERFRNDPYMKTILNHEMKHAYQDFKRITGGHKGIAYTKESQNVYTDDFVRAVKDRIDVGFFKEILKYYYLVSDLELQAFMENVYDYDTINDYRKMINKLRDIDAFRLTYYEDPRELEKYWEVLQSIDIPFIKKYKDYTSFLIASSKYFRKRSEEIIRKLDKMEYVHRDRE